MNWEKIAGYNCYNHFREWLRLNNEHDETINNWSSSEIRVLYDYFDSLGIIINSMNDTNKGSNIWHVTVRLVLKDKYITSGVYKSRIEAEQNGFEKAFELLENEKSKTN